jgi:membrane protein YqaA with SNARE-associated domain
MTGFLLAAFGVAFASALFPPVSIEVFVLGLAATQPQLSPLLIGAAVAPGQVGGKLLYFLAARGDFHPPKWLHHNRKTAKPASETTNRLRVRWQEMSAWFKRGVAWLQARCEHHPKLLIVLYVASSFVGIPPLMASTILAGLAHMNTWIFVSTGLVGRFTRFSILAASPAVVHHFHHHH